MDRISHDHTFEQKACELFNEYQEERRMFQELVAALEKNPAIFTRSDSDDLKRLQSIVAYLANKLKSPKLLRGDDFLVNEEPSSEACVWLYSHREIEALGVTHHKRKTGRLGAIIAMHHRRDELYSIITDVFLKNDRIVNVLPHIARLLTHEQAPDCEDFAIETLRHPESYKKIPGSSDGTDAFIYWTYGPYVLSKLKERGKKYDDFVNEWLEKRKKSREFRGNGQYPGIDYLYENDMARMHYLAKSGLHPSHTFVKFITDKTIIPCITQ